MAGPSLDTGQQIMTYLFLTFLPIFILSLLYCAIPANPTSRRYLMVAILRGTPWRLRGTKGAPHQSHRKCQKQYKKPISHCTTETILVTTRLLQTYLVPTAITLFKVGCRVEGFLRRFSCTTPRPLPAIRPITLHATNDKSGPIRFDLDSFAVGVDNRASYCMINSPHLFENSTLMGNTRQVDGISTGLAIEGEGTFKFSITDNNGQQHTIHFPNSLYVPKLEKCLLLPQHWAQEVGDNLTWMENLPTAASCTEERASKRPFHLTLYKVHRLSSRPHHQRHTACSPQHMRCTKPHSSTARPSSPSLGYSFRGRQPSSILMSSLLRKICISRKAGDMRLTRTSPRMTKPSKSQTYLNGSQTCQPPPTRPSPRAPDLRSVAHRC